jgi:uncharacterized membrane protein YjfL (UPF0719 family)
MFQGAVEFWSQNILLSNIVHVLGGFGLAIILQHYLRSKAILPVIVGWILLGFVIAIHTYAYMQ